MSSAPPPSRREFFLETPGRLHHITPPLKPMDIKLPHLGEGADSGTVVNLFVKEGDQIAKDQPVLELENEKAVATIPSTAAGTVTKVYVKAGDKLSVGQRILSLSGNGGPAPQPKAKPAASAPETEPSGGEEPQPD